MKWFLLLLISLMLSPGLYVQDQKSAKETRKEASQRKKEEKKAQIDKIFKITSDLLEGRRFVLEAQFLKNTWGYRAPVTSNINFISIDSLAGTLQVGSMQRVGYNGVGGITVVGRVTNWKLEKNDKQQNFYLRLTIQGNFGIYDITMSINYDGYSYATITGMSYGSLTYEGNLYAIETSSVFKGQHR
jgi:hypothetical protein